MIQYIIVLINDLIQTHPILIVSIAKVSQQGSREMTVTSPYWDATLKTCSIPQTFAVTFTESEISAGGTRNTPIKNDREKSEAGKVTI